MVVGFCRVVFDPLPRTHFHVVGLPVDLSEKLTVNGAQPVIGVAVKSAISCAETLLPIKIKKK